MAVGVRVLLVVFVAVMGWGMCVAECCVMLGLCDVGGCDVLFSSVFLCVAEESCAGGVLWC